MEVEVFTSMDKFNFNKTIVEMTRCTTDGDLVSRSQAKRVLARLDEFETAILDFKGITVMERGFADELFRVGLSNLTDMTFEIVNAKENIQRMIQGIATLETADRIIISVSKE